MGFCAIAFDAIEFGAVLYIGEEFAGPTFGTAEFNEVVVFKGVACDVMLLCGGVFTGDDGACCGACP